MKNKIILFLLLSLSLNAHALPWSTDMWEHPSIKPYEEARDYPENNVRKGQKNRELTREEYEEIQTGPNDGKASIVKGKELYQTYAMLVMEWMVMGMDLLLKTI